MTFYWLNVCGFCQRLITRFVVIVLAVVLFIDTGLAQGAAILPSSSPEARHESGTGEHALAETTVYLPIIYRSYPYQSIFGVETQDMDSYTIDVSAKVGAYWLRMPPFSWAAIEPVRTSPPTYHWETVNEAALRQANLSGMKVIATIRLTPTWAQKVPGSYCGPVAPEALDEFAEFLANLVRRYSAFPYNVQYWEIGNEVDVHPGLVAPDSIFGCWGDYYDAYYGGGYYAEMLKVVYPAIKAVDPQAQVMVGGLLVICDPTNPGTNDCNPANFLEGILKAGGAPYFDIVSFHAFAFYMYGKIFENLPTWGPRGGNVMGKVNFLYEVMARYGVNKPLMMTEASLLCIEDQPECNPIGDDFKNAQADYVAMLYTRTWNANLLGTIWYQMEMPGWRSSGLYGKPAFDAYQFLAKELKGARLIRPLDQLYAGVAGFEFMRDDTRIWVLWAPDRTDHWINLPPSLHKVYDRVGNPVTPVANQVAVNGTVVIELIP